MNKIHKRRLYYVSFFLIGIFLAVGLILFALKQNLNVFLTPSQLAARTITSDYTIRLGGMVKEKSVIRSKNDLKVSFVLTDLKADTKISFEGVLPDLFREGKGAVVEGTMQADGIFHATQVLAKHDENYMPKNVYKQIRENAEK